MATCSVPVCERKVYAKGLCQPHYGRSLKGIPLDKPIRLRATKTATVEEQLLAGLLDRPEVGCWEWKRAVTPAGYGKIGFGRKIASTHRTAYELWVGPIPDGAFILHTCDNPPCCRPDHLRLGTHDDNMADMVNKGRGHKDGHRGESNARARLTEADVLAIRADRRRVVVIAADYGLDRTYVYQIRNRTNWKHI